jgi:ankyrin repeat protein
MSCGENVLQAATDLGDESMVRLLPDKGADVDAMDESDKPWTALHIAASKGHEKIVRLLIDRSAISQRQRRCKV